MMGDILPQKCGIDLLGVICLAKHYMLETMQAGAPLVATDVGGIREIVRHDHNGLLIDHGHEEGFAKAMERLLTDKRLRSRLVENGYRTVRERFSIDRYASEIESIYDGVLVNSARQTEHLTK